MNIGFGLKVTYSSKIRPFTQATQQENTTKRPKIRYSVPLKKQENPPFLRRKGKR